MALAAGTRVGPYEIGGSYGVTSYLVSQRTRELANWLPARRASRVDPMVSLRAD